MNKDYPPVDELIKAAIAMVNAKPNDHPNNWGELWDNLESAVKPFRPKRPRVGYLATASNMPQGGAQVEAIELTDEVRDALAYAGILENIEE